MSDIARPTTPVPLADVKSPSDAAAARPALRDTGFFSLADIQRALSVTGATPEPRGVEPAPGR